MNQNQLEKESIIESLLVIWYMENYDYDADEATEFVKCDIDKIESCEIAGKLFVKVYGDYSEAIFTLNGNKLGIVEVIEFKSL